MENTATIDDAIDLDDPITMLFRKLMLESEAEKTGSELHCTSCNTHLPHRAPFVGWDEEGPSYYCSLCDDYFIIE